MGQILNILIICRVHFIAALCEKPRRTHVIYVNTGIEYGPNSRPEQPPVAWLATNFVCFIFLYTLPHCLQTFDASNDFATLMNFQTDKADAFEIAKSNLHLLLALVASRNLSSHQTSNHHIRTQHLSWKTNKFYFFSRTYSFVWCNT